MLLLLVGFALVACLLFSAVGIYLIVLGDTTGFLVLLVFGLGATITAPVLVSALKDKQKPDPNAKLKVRRERKARLSADEYKKQFEATIEELILNHSFEKLPGEMLPPWFMRILPFDLPTSEGHAYWTNGEGGYYWGRFLDFWVPLDLETKKSYFKRYDLGPSWAERHHWYSDLFDPAYAIDISDESALEQLADELLG